MNGSWIGISNIEAVLQINAKVVNDITKVKELLISAANIKNIQFKDTEFSNAQMMKDAEAVERLINILQEWRTNPWNTVLQSFWFLGSGLLASEKLFENFDTAAVEGEK